MDLGTCEVEVEVRENEKDNQTNRGRVRGHAIKLPQKVHPLFMEDLHPSPPLQLVQLLCLLVCHFSVSILCELIVLIVLLLYYTIGSS